MLFVDEAYQLNPRQGGQYMQEVVDELVKGEIQCDIVVDYLIGCAVGVIWVMTNTIGSSSCCQLFCLVSVHACALVLTFCLF